MAWYYLKVLPPAAIASFEVPNPDKAPRAVIRLLAADHVVPLYSSVQFVTSLYPVGYEGGKALGLKQAPPKAIILSILPAVPKWLLGVIRLVVDPQPMGSLNILYEPVTATAILT